MEEIKPAQLFDHLVQIMETLRYPGGCSWDRKQTHRTLKKYIQEESAEVMEAIDEQDPLHLCEELGDLLMLIVFHAQIAAEAGTFNIKTVLDGINSKLIERHPHVFKASANLTHEEVILNWGKKKSEEKKEKLRPSHRMEKLSGFSSTLQAALKVQTEARKVGFDFPNPSSALNKISEEVHELDSIHDKSDKDAIQDEIGDVLFSIVNVARLLEIDPDKALVSSTRKFINRFSKLEDKINALGGFEGKSLESLDTLWEAVKAE